MKLSIYRLTLPTPSRGVLGVVFASKEIDPAQNFPPCLLRPPERLERESILVNSFCLEHIPTLPTLSHRALGVEFSIMEPNLSQMNHLANLAPPVVPLSVKITPTKHDSPRNVQPNLALIPRVTVMHSRPDRHAVRHPKGASL